MSTLLILVKILSAMYQIKKIKDVTLLGEAKDLLSGIPISKGDLFTQDKKIETAIRDTIDWILAQPEDEPIIKSLLTQRVMDFMKDAPELAKAIEAGLEDYPSEERTRQIIYRHIQEVKKAVGDDKFNKDFKNEIKELYFGDPSKTDKTTWAKIADMIETKLTEAVLADKNVALVEEVNTDNLGSMVDIINRAKVESSSEGVMKLGMQGWNKAFGPDQGVRRSKFYLWNALTNRGKSLTLSHIIASIGLYNKPLLRDKSKIPTIVLDSAEDALDIIIERMYGLIMVNQFGHKGDFKEESPETIAQVIADGFRKNGWFLIINRVDPVNDNYYEMTDRIRKLQMKGHEIVVWAYDYLAMANLKGTSGESRSDKLQDLYKRIRGFIVNHGISFHTPHQLSPEAKRFLRESDDDAELNFAKEVGGKSMTEGSTKLTNEVDFEGTIHVARTIDDKAYHTFYAGKIRGEGPQMSDRFWIHPLDPVLGLVHDINTKPTGKKSFKHMLDENGESQPDFDFMG